MVNDTQDAADRCALGAYPRRGSGRSRRPRRARAVARATAVLTGHGPWRTASPGSRPAERPGRPRGVVPSEIGPPPRHPACLRCPEVPRATGPRYRVVLLVPRGSPGKFERPRRPGALRCRAKSVKKNAHGFFLASCGEAFGSRKKLQGKDLQKQKRCGLLECSCEDVRSSLAGGGELSTAEIRGDRPKALPGLSIRGSVAWIRWIDRCGAKEHRSRSGLVEVALVAWARAQGLQDPPARQESVEAAKFA